MQLPWMTEIGRPRVRRRLPAILSKSELAAVFRCIRGEHRLVAQLLHGTGMRLMEGLSLRVKDLGFAHLDVIVRHGKGGKDICTTALAALNPPRQRFSSTPLE